MTDGVSLSGIWDAFSKFVWKGGVTGGLTGCNSHSEQQPANVKLSQAELADAWEKTGLDKCSHKDPQLSTARTNESTPAFWDSVSARVFEQAAFKGAYNGLTCEQQQEAKDVLVETLITKYPNQTFGDVIGGASHGAACMTGGLYGNYFPVSLELKLTAQDVIDILYAAILAKPGSGACEGGAGVSQTIVLRESTVYATGRAGEPISLKPLYAEGMSIEPLPTNCSFVTSDQKVAVKFSKTGRTIFPLKVTPKGNFKLEQGTHIVGLECAGKSTPVGEIKVGAAAAKPKPQPKPAPKPTLTPKPTPKPKVSKPKPAPKEGPCDGLSGVFLSACKKNNKIQ